MPVNVSANIRRKMEQYAENPASLANNVIQMQGHEAYFHLRIGNWRVIFTETLVVVAVINIAARGSAYD